MITTKYYQRQGIPFASHTDERNGITVSSSNPPQPGDVEINQNAYNAMLNNHRQSVKSMAQEARDQAEATRNQIRIKKESAKVKLIALGLDEDEASAVTGV